MYGMWVHPCMWSVSTQTLISRNTQYSEPNRPTDSAKTVESITFSSLVLELFLLDFWQFECVWFSPWLSLLSISHALHEYPNRQMPVYEKWNSPSLHCHGDAQLIHQFCPFKDLHQSCCSDWEVKSVGREWFHPSLRIYEKLRFIFYNGVIYSTIVE